VNLGRGIFDKVLYEVGKSDILLQSLQFGHHLYGRIQLKIPSITLAMLPYSK
jgi:hypothetical protein